MAFKPLDRELSALFDLSEISLHPSTNNFEMTRFFPVIAWVDAGNSRDTKRLFDHVLSVASKQLKANGFSRIKGATWGPFKGSRYIGIFGGSKDEPNGKEFRGRLDKVRDGIASNIGPMKKGAKVLVIVGAAVVTITGGPVIAAATFGVPILVTKGIAISGTLLSTSGALKKIFEKGSEPTSPTKEAKSERVEVKEPDGKAAPPKADVDDEAEAKKMAARKRQILKDRKAKGPNFDLRPKR